MRKWKYSMLDQIYRDESTGTTISDLELYEAVGGRNFANWDEFAAFLDELATEKENGTS